MKIIQKVTLLLGFMISAALSNAVLAQNQDPALGGWHTVDDETGEIKSLVMLSLADDGTLVGVVTMILKEDAGSGLCEKCEGDLKDKPIEGMQFIWGVERTDKGEWEDGQILDPESGTIYTSSITIADDPNELEVRGYVGISLFGRSQTWQRAEIKAEVK
jgi:uncharacterized protein (DUF2147 family)